VLVLFMALSYASLRVTVISRTSICAPYTKSEKMYFFIFYIVNYVYEFLTNTSDSSLNFRIVCISKHTKLNKQFLKVKQ
jgi:hypothetical protein